MWCFFQSCCHFKRAFSSDCVTTRLRNILAGLLGERRASLAEAITLGELLYVSNIYSFSHRSEFLFYTLAGLVHLFTHFVCDQLLHNTLTS